MNRRSFLHTLSQWFQAALVAGLWPGLAAASVDHEREAPRLHYRPLNGRRLREIAARGEHHGPGRFLNPLGLERSGRLLQVLSWKIFHRNRFQDELEHQPTTLIDLDWEALRRPDGPSVTFLKHASVLIQDEGLRLLVDPIFAEPFWFIRDYTPLAFDPRAFPPPSHVLITHGHLDHLDTGSLAQLPRDTRVIAPLGYGELFDELGLFRRTELDWYGEYRDGGLAVTLLPCNHWTMRSPIVGPNTGLWGSYLVRTPSGRTLYISGDTAYFDGFDQIAEEASIDLAVFNLGAYEPRWFMAPSHIDPAETVRAFRELRARKLAIAHWGTFQLGDEPVHLPPQHIRDEMRRAGMAEHLIEWRHGQTIAV